MQCIFFSFFFFPFAFSLSFHLISEESPTIHVFIIYLFVVVVTNVHQFTQCLVRLFMCSLYQLECQRFKQCNQTQQDDVTFRTFKYSLFFSKKTHFMGLKRTQIMPDFVRNVLDKFIIQNLSVNLEGWRLLSTSVFRFPLHKPQLIPVVDMLQFQAFFKV